MTSWSRTRAHHLPTLIFLGVVAAVYTAAVSLARQLPHLEGADMLSVGLATDMVAVVPLAFYLLIVRRRGWPIGTLIPVVVLSLLAASRVLPADHQQPLRVIEVLAVPLELGLIGWIGWRATKAVRHARRRLDGDPLERLRRAAFEATRNDRVAGVFASEMGIFYYALGAWRARPHTPVGTSAFTHHQRSGQGGIVLGLLMLLAVEGFAVHMLLSHWNTLVAWVFTASTIYGGLWLLADYRATVLRPILVDKDTVLFRSGLRWTLRVPRDQILKVAHDDPELGKDGLKFTLLGTPSHWITFSEPAIAAGMYGTRRHARAVGIEPDEAAALERALDSPAGREDGAGDA